ARSFGDSASCPPRPSRGEGLGSGVIVPRLSPSPGRGARGVGARPPEDAPARARRARRSGCALAHEAPTRTSRASRRWPASRSWPGIGAASGILAAASCVGAREASHTPASHPGGDRFVEILEIVPGLYQLKTPMTSPALPYVMPYAF